MAAHTVNTDVRTHFVAGLALMSAGVAAQQADPYGPILAAVNNSLDEPRIFLQVDGKSQLEGSEESYLTRIWIQGRQLWLEGSISGKPRITIIADGKHVWRYDPAANEYTFLKQDPDLTLTLAVVVAWAREEAQRPLRLLAHSVRWLVKPLSDVQETEVKIWQTTGSGENWRGTILDFRFDAPSFPEGRMLSLTIEERFDQPDGKLKHARHTAKFYYPDVPYGFVFEFKPPPGAKPAADLPRRGGG